MYTNNNNNNNNKKKEYERKMVVMRHFPVLKTQEKTRHFRVGADSALQSR